MKSKPQQNPQARYGDVLRIATGLMVWENAPHYMYSDDRWYADPNRPKGAWGNIDNVEQYYYVAVEDFDPFKNAIYTLLVLNKLVELLPIRIGACKKYGWYVEGVSDFEQIEGETFGVAVCNFAIFYLNSLEGEGSDEKA